MDMGRKITTRRDASWAIAICLGSLPLMMALAPLSFSPNPAGWQLFVQFRSLIVPLVLFAIALIAMWEGSSVVKGWQEFPLLSRIAVVAWIPLILFTSFRSGNDHLSAAIGALNLGSILLLFLSMAHRNNYATDDFQRKMWLAVGFGALVYFVVFATYILSNDIEPAKWYGPFPGFHNIRHVAFLGFVAYGAGLHSFMTAPDLHPQNRVSVAALVPSIVGLVVVFWTGSRGPTLALLLLTISIFAIVSEKRKAIAGFALMTGVPALLIVSLLPSPIPMFGLFSAFGISDVNSATLDDASSGRLQIWLATFDRICERPLLGWGLGQYLKFNPLGEGTLAHPHNSILQLSFVAGVSGVLFSLLIALPIMFSKFDFGKSPTKRFHLALLGTLIIYSLYDGIFFYIFPVTIFTLTVIGALKKPLRDESG